MATPAAESHGDVDMTPGTVARRATRSGLLLTLSWAGSLVAVAIAFALSRSGRDASLGDALFWVGLALLFLPAVVVLTASAVSRSERIFVALGVGVLSFAVKVLHDPARFFASDEFTHLSVSRRMVGGHELLGGGALAGSNVAGQFPGLHTVTVTLAEMSGLSLHASGLLVIAVARVILMLGLFLLFERITGSDRLAGLGAMCYAVDANFLFWNSQFSYESLSLPLFVVTLLAVFSRPPERARRRVALTACALACIAATTVTHHLTSYLLAATLWGACILSLHPRWRRLRCPGIAAFATALPAVWTGLVATATGPYLSYVFHKTLDAVTGRAGSTHRLPFQSTSGLTTPIFDRGLAFSAAALLGIGVLYGLWTLRPARTGERGRFVILMLISGAFLVLVPLKLLPGAWETANRSGDFSCIGAALVLAYVLDGLTRRGFRHRALAAAALTIMICGAVVEGWPAHLLRPPPFDVKAAGHAIVPEGMAASQWAAAHLPPGATYVADEASGRELAVSGARKVYAGRTTGALALFRTRELPAWQRQLLARKKVDYVVLDRRKLSDDNLAGYYFAPRSNPGEGLGYYPAAVRTKYQQVPRSRLVLDSGDIVIYDVRGLREPPPKCADARLPESRQAIVCLAGQRVLSYAGPAGDVKLAGVRYRLLATRVEPGRRDGTLWVTVRIQASNEGASALALDPSHRLFRLHSGPRSIHRTLHTPDRTDTFDGRARLRVGEQRSGSLRFVLRGRAARRFRLSEALLAIGPAAVTQDETGLVRLDLRPVTRVR